MSNTRQVTREVRLRYWAEVLHEQQASGESISAWCETHGVKRHQFFYWQGKLREAAYESLALTQEMDMPAHFAEYRLPAAATASLPAVVLHLNCGRVEIQNSACAETIENTLSALQKLC